MNQVTASGLHKALQSCKNVGIGEWKNFIFSGDLKTDDHSLQDGWKTTAMQYLEKILPEYSSGKIPTFVKQKVYRKMSSIANEGSPNIFDGNPLPLEEHFDDIPVIEYGGTFSLGFDESYLVPETDLQKILSHLCCYFTSESGVVVPAGLLMDLFPLVIFYKATRHSPDQNAISVVTGIDLKGKLEGLRVQRITVSGPYPYATWRCVESRQTATPSHLSPSHNTDLKKFHEKCLQNLVKQHLGPTKPNTRTPVRMESYAEYTLLESNKPFLDNPNQGRSLTHITLSINCGQVKRILQDDIQHISSVYLKVTPVPGDMRSSAFSLYKTIQILEGLLSAFGESSEVKWTDDEGITEENQETKQKLTTKEKIHEIICSYGMEWMVLQRERKRASANEENIDKNETTDEQDSSTKQMIFPRQELDFTERIWEVMKYTSSCQELVDCFEIILKEITDGKSAQFWLHRNNSTILAKLVKESYDGDITTKIELTNANCIKLLIEIGLDKLGRDYHNFFISNRLASSGRLSEYFAQDKVEYKLDQTMVGSLQQRFAVIKKLHHITELIVQCKLFLCLSSEQIFSITRSALQSYLLEDVDFNKTFEFPLAYSEVETLVKDRLPSMWKLSIKSTENKMEKVSSHCWTTEYPFAGIISQARNDDDKTPDNQRMDSSSAVDATREYFISSLSSKLYIF